ncbi:MAG: hypothetical protein KJZ54_07820 [Phycisphaerales bacterium]|nr:hypothetical protein [Phycisphaerales bacterium]
MLSRAIAVLVVLLAIVPAAAQDRVDLHWRWVEGRSLTYRVVEEMDQSIAGDPSSALNWVRRFRYREAVRRVDGRGVATVDRTYEADAVEVTRDGRSVEYDSDRPGTHEAASDPLVAPFAAFLGKTISFDVDAEGRVLAVRGVNELMKSVTSPLSGGMLDAQIDASIATLTDESVRQQIERSLRLVPARAVRTGESWETSVRQPMPVVGVVESRSRHTLRGTVRHAARQCARIDTTGTLTLVRPEGDDLSRLLEGLVQVRLSDSRLAGETLFDHADGCIVRSEMSMDTDWSVLMPDLADPAKRVEQTQRLRQKATLELVSGG